MSSACKEEKLLSAPQESGRLGKVPVSVRFVKDVRQPKDCQMYDEQLEGKDTLMRYPLGLYTCCQPS